MKITIELTDNEVKALKAYLKEVSNDVEPVITKEDIKLELQGIFSGAMQTGALGDYYTQYNRGLQLTDNSNTTDNGHEDY